MGENIIMAQRQTNLPAALPLGRTQFQSVPAMARFVFRGAPEVQMRASKAIGIQFPETLRAKNIDAASIHWQGPDEFLILAPTDQKDRLFDSITNACGEFPHSLVDVSHRNVGFILDGSDVELLLATAVQLDLSVSSFPVGMSTRTLFAKADITLWRQDAQRFHIEVWRSFAPYVTGILSEGARGL